MTVTTDERAAMSNLFDEVGPDAPTMCEGWTTRDLLAHLLVRERRPDASGGILVPALAKRTERVMNDIARAPYTTMIEQFRNGPPLWSPFAIPFVGDRANVAEFFVHHEDIRRAVAEWTPRPAEPARDESLWKVLHLMGRVLYRRSPVGVTLRSAGHDDVNDNKKTPAIIVVG